VATRRRPVRGSGMDLGRVRVLSGRLRSRGLNPRGCAAGDGRVAADAASAHEALGTAKEQAAGGASARNGAGQARCEASPAPAGSESPFFSLSFNSHSALRLLSHLSRLHACSYGTHRNS